MQKNKLLSYFLFAALLSSNLFLNSIGYIIADENPDENPNDNSNHGIDDNPSEINNDKKRANERDINIDVNPDTATIKSALRPATQKDDFTIDIDARNSLKIQGLYKSRTENKNNNLEFQVEFYEILEFNDTNGNNIYDSGSDEVLQVMQLDNFSDIKFENRTSSNDTAIYVLTIKTSNEVFTCRIIASEGFINVNNTIVSPAEIKVDFEIHNFPYDSTESNLALAVRLQANAQYDRKNKTRDESNGFANNESAIETKQGDYTGFFSWNEAADIDGTSTEIQASPLKPDTGVGQKFYLNYPHGTDIIHDPKFGIDGIFPDSTNWILIIGIIGGIAIVVVVAIYLKKNR